MKLTIRTPVKEVFNKTVQKLTLDTESGRITVYPRHATFTAALGYSPIHVLDADGVEEEFIARRGIIMISNRHNRADILVLDCFKKSELIPATAREYLQYIEEQLKNKATLKNFHVKFLQEEKMIIERQVAREKPGNRV